MTSANALWRGSPGLARGLRSNAFCVFACFVSLSFAGLVVLARSLNPIPSRTRPLNSSAPMVLWLKPWESRSLPGLPRTKQFLFRFHDQKNAASLAQHAQREEAFFVFRVSSRTVDATLSCLRWFAGIGAGHVNQTHCRPLPDNPSPRPRRVPCASSFDPSQPP